MAVTDDCWDSPGNAQRYSEFARTHQTYRETSDELVSLANLTEEAKVVDLACGTGITTEALLSVLEDGGRVTAVDASEAMLAAAQSVIRDKRVRWVHASAERLDECETTNVDAVVCNAAIWQTDMQGTAAAVHRLLRPGGGFVFNLGAALLADHEQDNEPGPLTEAMMHVAEQDYQWTPSQPSSEGTRQPELSEASIRETLREEGFRVEQVQQLHYQASLDEQRAWLTIPVFTSRVFRHLTYEQRMAVLDKAYRRLSCAGDGSVRTPWVAFTAAARLPGFATQAVLTIPD